MHESEMYELTVQEVSNLRVFLNRVNLNANEIPAFLELIRIFSEPIDSPKKEGV